MGLSQTYVRFEEVFRQMWINNGNEVSKIYAGTGAIQGGSKVEKLTNAQNYKLLGLRIFMH